MVLGNEAASDLKGKEVVTSDAGLDTTESGKNTTIAHEGEINNSSSTDHDHHVDQVAGNTPSTTTTDGQAKNESSTTSDEQRKLSVLIVDDDNFIRLVHQAIARRLGLESQVAVNGQKAVDLHRSGASFDLILMDREMPVMNGLEATQELRAMGVDSMIVGVTASEGAELQTFRESGLDECCTKPLTENKLAPIIQVIKEAKDQKAENK